MSPSVRAKAFALVFLLCGASWAAAAPARVVVVSPYPQIFQSALAEFQAQFGKELLELRVSTTLRCSEVEGASALYLHGAFWSHDMDLCAAAVQRAQKRGMLVGGSIPAIFQASWRVTANTELNPAAPYLRFGGPKNIVGFLGALYNAVSKAGKLKLAEAEAQAEAGIYHPKAPNPFFSLDDYLAWYRSARLVPDAAPLVGLTFFQTNHIYGDLAHIDALIAAIEKRGIGVIPAFGWPLKAAQPFLFRGDKPAIELLLCLNLLMPSPENADFLAGYGIHAINLMTTTESFQEWSTSRQGLPPGRVALQLGTAERTGATEPILIATTRKLADGTSELVPVPDRIESVAARTARWLALRRKTNDAKRVALIYFNNPPGKGVLGASYLDLFPSLRNILSTLKKEDYLVDREIPTEDELQQLLLLSGRNVGDYAPGELDAMVRDGHVTLLSLERYEEWYRALPLEFRRNTEKTWGKPSESRLMTIRRDGHLYFVIAGVRLGNIFLGPQPLRDSLEAAPEMGHSADRAAPHSYIAYYLWLQHAFGADALVHIGRHGTIEWLPGKDVAQTESDPGDVLIGDLPHLYYYLVDGGGEFLQAKRRSQAVIISHLTPLLASAGLGPDYVKLKAALDNRAQLEEGDGELRLQYDREIADESRRLRLFEKLGLAASEPLQPGVVDRIAQYVSETEEESIPLGLHAIGDAPSDALLKDALKQYLLSSFSGDDVAKVRPSIDKWADEIIRHEPDSSGDPLFAKVRPDAEDWVNGLRVSGDRELESLIHVLAGRGLPTGVSGDPLRVPAAVPTGRNMHDMDPRVFPTKAAWDVGKRMAETLLDDQRKKKGQYPETVSFVLWYGESNRTQGIAEAQALYLLGAEPVWNGRGQVDDVKLIPAAALGRPRVDVVLTMSGLYRDGLPEKLELLDRAVKLVADAPDDNAIRRNAARVEKQLVSTGVTADTAKQVSLARLFGPAPQAFGVGLNSMMESSQDNNDQTKVAERYLDNMNYAYGKGLAGTKVAGNLEAQLSNNSVVIHSRSTNLYGVLDNDDTYQFAGGLNAATTIASGQTPDFLISNVRKAGREKFEDMKAFVSRELDSRTWNPKWIEAMKASGYSGAREMAKEVEHLYGLRATAPTQVDESAWQQMFDVYVKDKYDLGLSSFFEKENPYAQQMLAARLLEIDRQRVYQFTDADRQALLRTYIQSVNQFGVSCYANACGNPRLLKYMVSESQQLSAVSAEELARLQQKLRSATQVPAQTTRARPVEPSARLFTGAMPIDSLLPRIRRALNAPYRMDSSWWLVLLPLLLSPIVAFWRSRSRQWTYDLQQGLRAARH